MADNALTTARSYHDAWTRHDYDAAAALLAPSLDVEVPVNEYGGADEFASALRGFGSLARRVELIAATAAEDEAMLLYDMDVEGLGELRVAEHFTVSGGKIVRLRQIHDTVALRAAGFAGDAGATAPQPQDYRRTVRYEAPIERVFDAAATPSGPDGWWTTRGENVGRAGELMRLDWSNGDYILFRVEEVDRPNAMRWHCVEQRDGNLDPPDEWVGTTLSFHFAQEDGMTRLDFVHEGLVPALRCFEACEDGWGFFLHRSLRQLIELGEGLPFKAAENAA